MSLYLDVLGICFPFILVFEGFALLYPNVLKDCFPCIFINYFIVKHYLTCNFILQANEMCKASYSLKHKYVNHANFSENTNERYIHDSVMHKKKKIYLR